jgi:hypothetical protein
MGVQNSTKPLGWVSPRSTHPSRGQLGKMRGRGAVGGGTLSRGMGSSGQSGLFEANLLASREIKTRRENQAVPYVISEIHSGGDRMVVTERTLEISKKFYHPLARGEPLTPELLAMTPDPYVVKGPKKGRMPEIFVADFGVWTIKDSVKQIIEKLEPNVHAFIPLNLRVKKHPNRDWGQYYLLCPGQAIDAVVIDETDFMNGRGRSGFELDLTGRGINPTLSPFGDTVLEAQLIAGRHLWRGAWGRLGKSSPFAFDLFCSDELADQMRAARLDGWEFRPCKMKATP